MSVPVCRSVRFLCKERPLRIPFYVSVKPGKELGGCRVGYATPSPCIIVPTSSVSFEDFVDFRVTELDHNVKVELRFTSGHREVYIYPTKVWREVRLRFLDPLSRGYPPREQGLILYGPPGTGKTSMAEIISLSLGLYTVNITPNILSKYVGEAEKNLNAKLNEAESVEPSVVLLDDAEWLTMGRERQGGEEAPTYLGMMKLLLERLQRWSREKRRVIAILTTNINIVKIDKALRRSGRMGRPLFVPLPDFEAVRELLMELGVSPERAEELAVKIVNSGLPMSDVVRIANDVREGIEPKIEPVEGEGYVRFIPPTVSRHSAQFFNTVWRHWCTGFAKGVRVWLAFRPSYGIPLAIYGIGSVCRRPVILLNDPRNIEGAVATARMSDAVLIVNTELIHPDHLRFIASKAAPVPLMFVGTHRPEVSSFVLSFDIGSNIRAREAVVDLISRFYGIEVSERELRDIRGLGNDEFLRLIDSMALFRVPVSVIRRGVR